MDNMGCENIHKDAVHHKGLAGHPTHKKSEGPCHRGPRIVVTRIPWPFWWIHDEYVDDTPLEAPRAMALPPLQEVYASLNTSVSKSFGEQGSPKTHHLVSIVGATSIQYQCTNTQIAYIALGTSLVYGIDLWLYSHLWVNNKRFVRMSMNMKVCPSSRVYEWDHNVLLFCKGKWGSWRIESMKEMNKWRLLKLTLVNVSQPTMWYVCPKMHMSLPRWKSGTSIHPPTPFGTFCFFRNIPCKISSFTSWVLLERKSLLHLQVVLGKSVIHAHPCLMMIMMYII